MFPAEIRIIQGNANADLNEDQNFENEKFSFKIFD
jgi:hypothetical protein